MKYIDAGYIVGLGGIALYAAYLTIRRFRLERAARALRARVSDPERPR